MHKVNCNCDVCKAKKQLADDAIKDNQEILDNKTPKEHLKAVEARMEGAPPEIRKMVRALAANPSHERWAPVSHHLVSLMVSPTHTFTGQGKTGSISVGIVNEQKYAKDDMDFATLVLGKEKIKVCAVPDLKDKKIPVKDFLDLEPNIVGILLDVPMSFIWGEMTYKQATEVMTAVTQTYAEEYSLEKALARKMEPLTKRQLDNLDQEIAQAKEEMIQAQQTVRDKVGVMYEKTVTRNALKEGNNADKTAKDLYQLLTTGNYSDFRIEGESLVFMSKDVTLRWEGYAYKLGDFLIDLKLTDGRLKITKPQERHLDPGQGQRVRDRTHPHVMTDGTVCIGTYDRAFAEHIHKLEYAEAVLLSREFLASYNPAHQFAEVHLFLPDRYYDVWIKDHRARPWENDDGMFYPGVEPSKSDYKKCYTESKANILKTGKLRCLKKPFGATCEACPHFNQGYTKLYKICSQTADSPTCMKCAQLDCPHFNKAEDNCFNEKMDLVKKNKTPLECVECPYHRAEICSHWNGHYQNCWSIQAKLPVAERACKGCQYKECPNYGKQAVAYED